MYNDCIYFNSRTALYLFSIAFVQYCLLVSIVWGFLFMSFQQTGHIKVWKNGSNCEHSDSSVLLCSVRVFSCWHVVYSDAPCSSMLNVC